MKITLSATKPGPWTVATVKKAVPAAWKKVEKERKALLKANIDKSEKDSIKPIDEWQLKQRSDFVVNPGKSVSAQAEMLINLSTGTLDDGRSVFFDDVDRSIVLINGNLYVTKGTSQLPGRIELLKKLKDTEALEKELFAQFCKLREDAGDDGYED